MTEQTNYVRQTKTELKWNYDQMTNERQDFYDHDAIQHKYLDILGMTYPQDEDPYLQEEYGQRQEKPKLKKNMGKLQRELKFLEWNEQRVGTK